MMTPLALWLTLICIGLLTFAIRLSFITLLEGGKYRHFSRARYVSCLSPFFQLSFFQHCSCTGTSLICL